MIRRVSLVRVFILVVCVAALSASTQALAQQRKRGASGRRVRPAATQVRFANGRSAKVPLELDGNIIFLRVSVNKSKPLKFLFDTGASVSVIDQARADELGLKATGRASGTATGGAIEASLIEGVSLGVPGAEVSNQLVASMPFGDSPVDFDGIIGYDFINQFVVELDYRGQVMNLHSPRTYAYDGGGEVVPLLIAGRRTPLVRTQIVLEGRAPVAAALEVDTGADGTFLLNSPFVRKQNLSQSVTDVVLSGGIGAGGEQQRLVGRVKAVRFGRIVIDNPPVGLSLDTEGSGASEENDGIIGGEIFRRFKVILDYSRRRMILEPNESFKDPYDIELGRLTFWPGRLWNVAS